MGRQSRSKREKRVKFEDAMSRGRVQLAASSDRRCLFCLSTEGPFRSREHIVPESLGNTELILPPGVVCDDCNNGVLSDVDMALCDFGAISIRRTMLGVPSKHGKVPTFRFTEGTMEHLPGVGGSDPTLRIMSRSPKRQLMREVARLSDGGVKLQLTGTGGPRMTPRYAALLSRALLKQALECAWLDSGNEAFGPRYDHIRAAVLGSARNGYLALSLHGDLERTGGWLTCLWATDNTGQERMIVIGDYFGVSLGTDSRLGRMPMDLPPEQVAVFHFAESGDDVDQPGDDRSGRRHRGSGKF